MSTLAPLPADSVVLHIGPHKTGTTAIQGLLASARDEMAEHGVHYLTRRPTHHDAARAVIAQAAGWNGDREALPDLGLWDDMVRESREVDGRSVISSEFFALTTPEQRAKIAADLGAERLHVVVAARNPAAIALSAWQQLLRDGKADHLDAWLHDNYERERPEPVSGSKGFWSWADTANHVDKWIGILPRDHIHVIALDEADKRLLPRTFEQLLDLPEGVLADRTPPLGNRSLSAPEAELLRSTIALTKDELTWPEFSLVYRFGFSSHLLHHRTPSADEPRSSLPAWAADQSLVEADAAIARIEAAGVPVVGDLATLRRTPAVSDAPEPTSVSVELASQALAGVVLVARKELRKRERQAVKREEAVQREQAAVRKVEDVPTRELAGILRRRIRAGLRRRVMLR